MAQKLSNLPIGAKVKFGKYSVEGEVPQDITWLVVAKNHVSDPVYPYNSVTLMAEKILDLRAFDASEPTSSIGAAKIRGNTRYEVSNIRQWLNSSAGAGEWYSPQHSADQSPTSAYASPTPYDGRPGFLNAFTEDEKNAILPTTIRCYYPSASVNLTDKVFLPSWDEIMGTSGLPVAEGSQFAYSAGVNSNTLVTLTSQAYAYTRSTYKPYDIGAGWVWWLRSVVRSSDDIPLSMYVVNKQESSATTMTDPNSGTTGVRPVLNLSSTLSISDTADSDGCYSTLFNIAPPRPSTLNAPTVIYGGKPNTIVWSNVTDPDGDTVTYQLECSINGGGYTQIYNGTAIAYAHLVPFGTSTVTYRVKATDPSGESSDYTTSATKTVVNNNAPVIVNDDDTQTDKNLGVKDVGFTGTYKITDANSDIVTVTEAIDGVQIRSLVATLGEEIDYGVTENTWLALSNGSHTLTISATDGIDTTVRTYVFTKLVDSFTIRNTTPWVSSTLPSRIMLVITRNIPSAATFKVEVCNNGYDANPTWEDATDAVMSGLAHPFSNKVKTAGSWGVVIRVTVERNGATGACYVSAIGGNFE